MEKRTQTDFPQPPCKGCNGTAIPGNLMYLLDFGWDPLAIMGLEGLCTWCNGIVKKDKYY